MYIKLAAIFTLVYIHLSRSETHSINDDRGLNIIPGVNKVKEMIQTISVVSGSNPVESTTSTSEQTLNTLEGSEIPTTVEENVSEYNGGVENTWASEIDISKPDPNSESVMSLPSKICSSCSCTEDDIDENEC